MVFVCAVRCWTVSDLHVDYPANLQWVADLSRLDYQADILLMPGDISADPALQRQTLVALRACFAAVFFVPGNHDVWVRRGSGQDSLSRMDEILGLCASVGVDTEPRLLGKLWVVPLLAWYDFSFGQPSADLRSRWADFRHCRWPAGMDEAEVCQILLARNQLPTLQAGQTALTLSHFLPRPDALPERVDPSRYFLLPVLGTAKLETQIRQVGPRWHVFGHSHLNSLQTLEGITYCNNAFGYPSEGRFTAKKLVEIPL